MVVAGGAAAQGEPPLAPGSSSENREGSAAFDASHVREAVRRLDAAVRKRGGVAGVAVVDVATGALLVASNEHAVVNPASNAKVATAAAALAELGPAHRFVTGLYGRQAGGTVPLLVLRGGGDPSFATRDLAALVRALVQAGVRRVEAIAVDQGYFDDRFVPPAFDQQPDEWAAFRAPVAALSLDENAVTFTVRPGRRGAPAAIAVEPPGLVELSGGLVTSDRKQPERVAIALRPKGRGLSARVEGSVPEGARPLRLAKRLDDPRLAPGLVLRALLVEEGVEVTGDVRAGGEGERKALALHRSPPLGRLVAALGKDSDNFAAEMILKALGVAAKGRPGTSAVGAEAVAAYLRRIGAWEEGCVVRNGSGLFDANRTTAAAMTALLRHAYRDSAIGPELVAHLAVGGVDGTLRARFAAWAARRAVRAKTGTLRGVTALSGYVLAPPGRSPVAFSVLVDGVPDQVPAVRPLVDEVVDAVARELWR